MIVVYAATRNLYRHLLPAMRSLLHYNPNVEKIILLLEDNVLGLPAPDCVEVINVVPFRDALIDPKGPNANTVFSWQASLRLAYPIILSEDDRVISLDVDTIVCDSLQPIWDVDLTDKWVGMVREKTEPVWRWSSYRPPYPERYFNAGVMVWNLAQMRKDRIVGELIERVNTARMDYVEQDTLNEFGNKYDKIVELPLRYNECKGTGETDNPAIVHYAGVPWKWTDPDAPRHAYMERWQREEDNAPMRGE